MDKFCRNDCSCYSKVVNIVDVQQGNRHNDQTNSSNWLTRQTKTNKTKTVFIQVVVIKLLIRNKFEFIQML
uniref:Ovule protein n=1 Tax=Panagrolaimus sp. JU765 TaxID=591449 RepID=A0AC34Q2Y6_9BILA